MQQQPRYKLFKKLFIGSLSVFLLSLVISVAGLFSLYGDVSKCGFSSGNCEVSNSRSDVALIGSYVVAVSFAATLIFLVAFLLVRPKKI